MTSAWRSNAPEVVRRGGRSAYVALGRRTPVPRIAPSFVLAGVQRAGTTSLFRALSQHPALVRPTFHKGVNYFDLNYFRGPRWYAAHFPTTAAAGLRAPRGTAPQAFEASGYYLYHPFALERLAADLPDVRLVVMLRDPVERAYSAWKHESARGFDDLDFEAALRAEDDRLAGEVDRMARDVTYESHAHRHHSYRRRGEYLGQLAKAVDLFTRERVHVIYSEEFFADPRREYDRLCRFLGVAPHGATTFEQHNARPSRSMPEGPRRRLTAHFAAERGPLEDLVGRPAPW